MINDEMTLNRITTQALRLPPLQKVQLVEHLMVTLQRELAESRSKPTVLEQKDGVQLATEDLFKQKLLEIGLLTEIRSPKRRSSKRSAPLRITGKRLSEIVIEDRLLYRYQCLD